MTGPHESAGKRLLVTESIIEIVEERRVFKIPAYGYLERIELTLEDLLPNFDASACYWLEVKLRRESHDAKGRPGHELPVIISAVFRNVDS